MWNGGVRWEQSCRMEWQKSESPVRLLDSGVFLSCHLFISWKTSSVTTAPLDFPQLYSWFTNCLFLFLYFLFSIIIYSSIRSFNLRPLLTPTITTAGKLTAFNTQPAFSPQLLKSLSYFHPSPLCKFNVMHISKIMIIR